MRVQNFMDGDASSIIGRGRSGTVFRLRDEQGRDTAHKRFHCKGLARLVHLAVFGCSNPYVWCPATVQAAVLRRQILGDLVAYWMHRRLRVAEARGSSWTSGHGGSGAYALQTEWIDGRHAALHQPFRNGDSDEARELWQYVMRPLQRRLVEAGFDGVAWQAGLGNPVAANNFMLERCGSADRRWVWIDLESGVPALFAINPAAWWRFYLPRSWRCGGALLDDVDVVTLRRYVNERMASLRRKLGPQRCAEMLRRIEQLDGCQNPWRHWRRVDRSIQCQLRLGHIDAAGARWYSAHPFAWYGREAARGMRRGLHRTVALAGSAFRWLGTFDVRSACRGIGLFMGSQQYRAAAARRYVGGRIECWHRRGQIDDDETAQLQRQIETEEAGPYITDFGVHLLSKPVAKVNAYVVVPYLVAIGVLGAWWLAIAILFSGPAVRTIYTGGRLVQSVLRREEKPWLALFLGVVPIAGNVAYPLQIIYCTTGRDRQAAGFILYDVFSRVGEKLPIWGGRDTLTEHLFNRIGDIVIRRRDRDTSADPLPSRSRWLMRNAG